MPEISSRLSAALSDRYRIEREIGAGGMATVYLAHDVRHDRQVAIKVLRPELAAAMGPERFLREITTTANLRHPHILPLYDSGDADGFLFYVMPYIEGESLRDRLARERQLPLEDAVRIACEVADALSHAHGRGVIHRDIKPENILLERGHAVVADFGVARAVDAAGGAHLTETGIAVGTPAYMSPEQGVGSGELDGRSDLYSLGCVLYEMLSGEPPYAGPTAQAIIAKKLSEPTPRVSVVRDRVPPAVEAALERVLSRNAVDRFATAAAFAEALARTAESQEPVTPGRAPSGRRLGGLAIAATAAGAALLIGYLVLPDLVDTDEPVEAAPAGVDPAVAVLPFRAIGPELEYYREGMVDLLSDNLEGVPGLQKTDPRVVTSAWRTVVGGEDDDASPEQQLAVARRAGARYAVTSGSVVRLGDGIRILAEVRDVRSGALRGSAHVDGSPDSVVQLVDNLTVELLRDNLIPTEGGLPQVGLNRVTTSSLPALKAYLAGERAYRRSRWPEAAQAFQRAVELDSTFARAYLRLASAYGWMNRSTRPYLQQAMRFVGRLSERDSLLVVGRADPHPTDRVHALRELTRRYPDDVDGWFELGEQYFHSGGVLLYPADLFRSAMERALELDPYYGEHYTHLIEDAFTRLDGERARELIDAYEALDPAGTAPCPASLLHALVFGDDPARARALDAVRGLSESAVTHCVQAPLAMPPEAVEAIERTRLGRLSPGIDADDRFVTLFRMLQARAPLGRLGAARRVLERAAQLPVTRVDAARFQVQLHLSGFPDTVAFRSAVEVLAESGEWLDHFWLGAVAVAEERWNEVERAAGALDARARQSRASDDARAAAYIEAVGRALRIYADITRGDLARLPAFETVLQELPAAGWRVEHPHGFLRYDVGRLLYERGKAREAERYFLSFYHYQALYLTPAKLYLGRIYEGLDRPQQALAYYDDVVTWWRDADPELGELRDEARKAALRLRERLR